MFINNCREYVNLIKITFDLKESIRSLAVGVMSTPTANFKTRDRQTERHTDRQRKVILNLILSLKTSLFHEFF
jgi:hypothetical protein